MTASLLAPARAVLSGAGLTSSECYELAIAARCLPGYWDVQWDKDDQGHLSLALLQDDGVVGARGRLPGLARGRLPAPRLRAG